MTEFPVGLEFPVPCSLFPVPCSLFPDPLGPTCLPAPSTLNRMISPALDPADDQFSRELEDLLWFIMKEMDFWENIPSRKEQEATVGRTRRAVSSRPDLGPLQLARVGS
ncbi:unnamed protein product [Arctogadus glacialis]